MASARWLELSVRCDVEAVEAVSEVLGRHVAGTVVRPTRLRADPADEQTLREDPSAPYEVSAHVPDGPAAAGTVESIERALWHLQAFGLGAVDTLRVRPVDERDWAHAWRDGYVAQRIGRIVVVPSWLDEPRRPGDVQLRIDPGMAFGTGLHPTTRGCLALLDRLAGGDGVSGRVLDVGSGSGILALAALRLGASSALAYDTDPVAVEATARNAERNGVHERVEVVHGTLPERAGERFGLVLANLVASLLVGLAGRLAAHAAPGADLLASGIIAPREGEVRDALAAAGFALRERHSSDDGEWVALRLQRAA
ncbi:MAG TPA: 50S ribosomal protein L11 methyltransferase [Candidatus Limnocylindria bacterium]|nr:50S ribosomal protein L11 methyltransferase [Candidatus Limnocylindria bacterium]